MKIQYYQYHVTMLYLLKFQNYYKTSDADLESLERGLQIPDIVIK